MQDGEARSGKPRLALMVGIAIAGLGLGVPHRDARAGEVVFLRDGHTIQADKTEVIGDRVRIQRPTEVIEVPRSSVLSIHQVAPRGAGTGSPPAKLYPGLTQDLNERVRQEIQQGRSPSRP